MITRDLTPSLKKDATKAPVIAILGPRQSGKTTLARVTFPDYTYVSFEDTDIRAFATADPRGFLAKYTDHKGVILDEVQHVPSILSYIQTIVDLKKRPGYFIITGSQNFLVTQSITQTLAGRISLHTLLPLSINELKHAHLLSTNIEESMLKGFYPRIFAEDYDPIQWYTDYVHTYIEREVRTITNIADLNTFRKFVQLCAGRIGQLINLTSLGNDTGISYNTARAWLSVLEASYIIFFLQPHYKNFSKRLIKAPKLYFYDTGLASSLLGIETKSQLSSHYLRGGLFESMVISDLIKNSYNADRKPRLYFWRDKTGHEVDCIIERGGMLFPLEIKSGMTIMPDQFGGLSYWNSLAKANPAYGFLIYAGIEDQKWSFGNVISWTNTTKVYKDIEKWIL